MALEFYDTFTREEASDLGVSDSGHTWTVSGTGGSTSVDGSAAVISVETYSTADPVVGLVDGVDEVDVDLVAQFEVPVPPAGDSTLIQLLSRYSSGTTYCSGRIALNPDGTSTATLRDDAIAQATASAGSWTGFTTVNLHYRVVGTSHRLKVWYGEDSEPANWTVSKAFSSSNTSGQVGFRVYVGSSSSVTLPYIIKINSATFSDAEVGAKATDTFTRTASDLGVADSDHLWTTPVLTGAISTNGTEAVAAVMPAQEVTGYLDVPTTDLRMSLDVGIDAISASSTPFIGAVARRTDASNYMWFYLAFSSAGTFTAIMRKTIGGSSTTLAQEAGIAYAVTDRFRIVAEVTGSAVKMKVWKVGTTEPANWTLTATDADLPPEGGFGFRALRGAGGTASAENLYLDNLSVRDVSPTLAVEVDNNPDSPGVRITISNGDVYDAMLVQRVHVENEIATQAVRGLDEVQITSEVASAVDYEIPLDETFVYEAVALDNNGTVVATTQSDPVIIVVPYHRVILRSVGQPTLSTRVQITAFPGFSQELRVLQEAPVLGQRRKVILFDVMEGMTGSFEFMTLLEHDPAGWHLRDLINEGQPLLFQSVSRITGIPDFFFVVRSVEAVRKETIRAGGVPRYLYKVSFEEVNRPPTDSETLGFFSWQTLLDVEHLSWQSVDDTFTNWLAVLNFTSKDPL